MDGDVVPVNLHDSGVPNDARGDALETVIPVLVGLLLFFYVSLEKAPFHRSRFCEQVYLSSSYLLALFAVLFQHFRHHAKFITTRQVLLNCIGCPIILTELFWETIDVGTVDDFHPKHKPVSSEAIRAYRFIAVRLNAIASDGGVFFRYDRDGIEPLSMAGRMVAPLGSQVLIAMMAGVQTGYVRTVVDMVVVVLSLIIVLARLRKGLHHIYRDPRLRVEIEAQIEEIRVHPETFDGMICRLGCTRLIEQLGCGWVVSLVKAGLVKDFSLATRAAIVSALSRTGPVSEERQRLIVELLTSASGWDLTALKNLIELGARWKNLHAIVRNSLSEKLREELLQRWAELSPKENAGLKVLCDIDDTLTCSGGHFPSGCDKTWVKHSMYPASVAFLRALHVANPGCREGIGRIASCDAADDSRGDGPQQPLVERKNLSEFQGSAGLGIKARVGVAPEEECNLIFLSARPHMYKGIAERITFSLFDRLVLEEKLHTSPQLLPGTFYSGMFVLLKPLLGAKAWGPIGRVKFQSVKLYMRLFPEYSFVFVGDNGQGDVFAAEMMTEQLGERFIGSYIHRVLPEAETLSNNRVKTASSFAAHGLYFFDTYAGAAALAFQKEHIDEEGLNDVIKVAEEAKKEFYRELETEEHARKRAWYARRRGSMSEVIKIGSSNIAGDPNLDPLLGSQKDSEIEVPKHLRMLEKDLVHARNTHFGASVSESALDTLSSWFSPTNSSRSNRQRTTHRTYHPAVDCAIM